MKFGVLGCGNIASHHASAIKYLGHDISSVLARPGSARLDSFSTRFDVSETYTDLKEFLSFTNCDGYIIATSWDATEKIVEEVIATGKPILVEKPVALTSNRLREIIKSSERYEQNVLVGYNRRFYDFIPYLKKELSQQKIFSISVVCPESLNRVTNKLGPKVGKYFLVFMTSHCLDLVHYLVGNATIVWSVKQFGNNKEIAAYNAILTANNGTLPIYLNITFGTPAVTSITFYCEEKIYELAPIEELRVYEGVKIVEPTSADTIRRYCPNIVETLRVNTEFKPGFLGQFMYFLTKYFCADEPLEAGCTLQEALKTTQLCETLNTDKDLRSQ